MRVILALLMVACRGTVQTPPQPYGQAHVAAQTDRPAEREEPLVAPPASDLEVAVPDEPALADESVGLDDSPVPEEALDEVSGEEGYFVVEVLKGPYLQDVTSASVKVVAEVASVPLDGGAVQVGKKGQPKDRVYPFTYAKIATEMLPIPGTYLAIAVLDNLEPATDYDYCVTLGPEPVCETFRTAPKNHDPTPFCFFAYGDTRTDHDAHKKVVTAMVATTPRPHLAIQTGDLPEIGSMLSQWQTFFDIEEPLLRFAPYYPVIGNHDDIFFGLDYYLAWFVLPAPEGGDERNYSFTYGTAAFVGLDTEEDITKGPIFEWLDSELARLDAEGYMIFVVTHEPMYSFSTHGHYWAGPEPLIQLYKTHHVSAVLSGHNHCYEHFLADGIHYFTLGGGGAPLYATDTHVIPEQKKYEVMARSVHHHALVCVEGSKATLTAIDDDANEVMEVVQIERP